MSSCRRVPLAPALRRPEEEMAWREELESDLLDFHDSAFLVKVKGLSFGRPVVYFLHFPEVHFFHIGLGRMKTSFFFALQQHKFVGVVGNDLPFVVIAFHDSLVIIDIQDVHGSLIYIQEWLIMHFFDKLPGFRQRMAFGGVFGIYQNYYCE